MKKEKKRNLTINNDLVKKKINLYTYSMSEYHTVFSKTWLQLDLNVFPQVQSLLFQPAMKTFSF